MSFSVIVAHQLSLLFSILVKEYSSRTAPDSAALYAQFAWSFPVQKYHQERQAELQETRPHHSRSTRLRHMQSGA